MSNFKTQLSHAVVIWVDHHEAFIAKFNQEKIVKEEKVIANIDPNPHGKDWSKYHLDMYYHEQMNHFYDEIVNHLEITDQIVILGPGQAKYELRNRIDRHKSLKENVVSLKTSDKKTQEQFLNEARRYTDFGLHWKK